MASGLGWLDGIEYTWTHCVPPSVSREGWKFVPKRAALIERVTEQGSEFFLHYLPKLGAQMLIEALNELGKHAECPDKYKGRYNLLLEEIDTTYIRPDEGCVGWSWVQYYWVRSWDKGMSGPNGYLPRQWFKPEVCERIEMEIRSRLPSPKSFK